MKKRLQFVLEFIEWYRNQPFYTNPYIRIDYLLKYWLNNIKNR